MQWRLHRTCVSSLHDPSFSTLHGWCRENCVCWGAVHGNGHSSAGSEEVRSDTAKFVMGTASSAQCVHPHRCASPCRLRPRPRHDAPCPRSAGAHTGTAATAAVPCRCCSAPTRCAPRRSGCLLLRPCHCEAGHAPLLVAPAGRRCCLFPTAAGRRHHPPPGRRPHQPLRCIASSLRRAYAGNAGRRRQRRAGGVRLWWGKDSTWWAPAVRWPRHAWQQHTRSRDSHGDTLGLLARVTERGAAWERRRGDALSSHVISAVRKCAVGGVCMPQCVVSHCARQSR